MNSYAKIIEAIKSFQDSRNIQLSDFSRLHNIIDTALERRDIGRHIRLLIDLLWTDKSKSQQMLAYTSHNNYDALLDEHTKYFGVNYDGLRLPPLQRLASGYLIESFYNGLIDQNDMIRNAAQTVNLLRALIEYFEFLQEISDDANTIAEFKHMANEAETDFYYSYRADIEDSLLTFVQEKYEPEFDIDTYREVACG